MHAISDTNQSFAKCAQTVVATMLDWETARSHDGKNIPAGDWARLPEVLRERLKAMHPEVATNSDVFGEFDMLVGATRNLTTVSIMAHDIVVAHFEAHQTGSSKPLTDVKRTIERRTKWAEKNCPDLSHDPLFHVAAMLSEADMLVQKRADAARASQRPSTHQRRLKV